MATFFKWITQLHLVDIVNIAHQTCSWYYNDICIVVVIHTRETSCTRHNIAHTYILAIGSIVKLVNNDKVEYIQTRIRSF